MDTGKNDVNALDMVYSWNNMTNKLSKQFWYNGTARMINGTGYFYLIVFKLNSQGSWEFTKFYKDFTKID